MNKRKPKVANIPMALVWSMTASMGTTLLATAVMAFLVAAEQISMEGSGAWILGILLLASVAGSLVAIKQAGEKPLILGLFSAGLYYLLLLCCTALFFGGQYQGMGVTALVVVGGCMSAVLLTMRKGSGKEKKRYRIR